MPGSPWCWLVAALLWSVPSFSAEPSDEKPRVHLSPGSQRVLTLPPEVRGISVRDEALVAARFVGPRQLLLIGLREGLTELVLHDAFAPMRRMDVRLELRDACALVICEPCELLPKGHMLQLRSMGEFAGLGGIAWSLEEARAVRLIAVRYPDFPVEVRLARRALEEGLLRVNHALWRAGFLHARARVVDGRVLLSGRFASEADEARAREAIASTAAWLEEALLPLAEEEPAP